MYCTAIKRRWNKGRRRIESIRCRKWEEGKKKLRISVCASVLTVFFGLCYVCKSIYYSKFKNRVCVF